MIRELEYRSEVSDPAKLEKKLDLLHPESVDIESLLRDEHLKLPLDLCWTVDVRTVNSNLSLILHRRRRTNRTLFWYFYDLL